jgi:predicted PurR-regulated permease PerM
VNTRPKTSERPDPFKITLLIFAIIAFMYFTSEVLKPLALSVLLSFALAPAAQRFERWGLPRLAAVLLTVVISLTLLAGIGFVVGQQLTSLAARLPDYQKNIEGKLSRVINPGASSTASRLKDLANEMTARMEKPPVSNDGDEMVPIPKVVVVSQPSFHEQFRSVLGPYLEFLGVSGFVLVLVLFMLMGRDKLSDRIVGLFGHHHVSLTTRTMQELGGRISRYLGTITLVNSGFGLVIGLGLGMIGVPYAVLWGCLAAMLRFIPYVGTAVAFVLPLVFSFAFFPGWVQPLEVVALFVVVEVTLSSFLEPIIYGKTTGISALGLLVAALFWTWLWGTLGLLLSTPLTVCLAVLGKCVPSMWFFAALLSEDAELEPDVQFYQRLVALDREGAIQVVETALKKRSRVEVFDEVLVPTLSRAGRDANRDELDDTKREFIWGVVSQILDGLDGTPDLSLASLTVSSGGEPIPNGQAIVCAPIPIVGLAVQDTADMLVLRMLGQLLAPSRCILEIVSETESTLELTERVADQAPKLVVVSYLPPKGLAMARYLVRRLRTQLADLPIIVGRWGSTDDSATAVEKMVAVGASRVDFTLADARTHILGMVVSDQKRSLVTAEV